MKRIPGKNTDTFYDLVVIGGGIHGAAIAWHGARAGFSTLLLEKKDFAGATSANSLKILHGGLRYLQHLDIKRMRQSICSRREIMQLAPHLVQPLACLMPAYGHGVRGKEIMRGALLLNDMVGWDRNRGIDRDKRLARGKIIDRQTCKAVISGIPDKNLHGGVVWHDALVLNTERLVLEYVLAAVEAGAEAANYAEVIHLEEEGTGSCSALIVHDRITGEEYEVRAKCIVNAAGPWLDHLLQNNGIRLRRKMSYALALNIVVDRPLFRNYAVALEGSNTLDDQEAFIKRGKRLYFFVPWGNYMMIGTNYRICEQHPGSFAVRREDIHTMVDEINRMYDAAQLRYEDVTFYHAGLLPLSSSAEDDNSDIQLEKNSRVVSHEHSGFSGFFSVRSVKYTTAPALAREVIEHIRQKINPASKNLSAPMNSEKKTAVSGTRELSCMPYLRAKYGPRAEAVYHHIISEEGGGGWISTDPPLLRGEVEYCIAREMAFTLEDIVLRRTDLGTAACPPAAVLERLASFMAEKLGWNSERKQREIEAVVCRYSLLEHYHGAVQ